MTRTTAIRPRPLAALVLTVALALSAAGCGGSDGEGDPTASPEPSASQSSTEPTSSSSAQPTEQPDEAIAITFDGDTVTPNGDRVEVEAGEEVTFSITADAPGELHVHSTPEQVLSYEQGASEMSLTIDQPGIVEVESHHLGVVVVQLEVR